MKLKIMTKKLNAFQLYSFQENRFSGLLSSQRLTGSVRVNLQKFDGSRNPAPVQYIFFASSKFLNEIALIYMCEREKWFKILLKVVKNILFAK